MSNDDRRNERNGDEPRKSWAEWKQELFEAIEELDRACANARQVIYRLRPLVRPKQAETTDDERPERDQRSPTPFRGNRRRGPRER